MHGLAPHMLARGCNVDDIHLAIASAIDGDSDELMNSLEAGQLHSSVFRLDASVCSQVEETRTVLSGGFPLLASDGAQPTPGIPRRCMKATSVNMRRFDIFTV